jgi:hypothetical protein
LDLALQGPTFRQRDSDPSSDAEVVMDEQLTLRILGWTVTGVVMILFALSALALPH